MWDLLFRIGGDTSPLKREMEALGPHMDRAGKKIGERFHLGISHGIAAIAIGAGVAVQRALGESIGSAMESLQKSAALRTTVDEFEMLSRLASQTGESVENLTKALRLGGVAAGEIRKAMAEIGRASGPTQNDADTEQLALLGNTGDRLWTRLRTAIGGAAADLSRKAAVFIGGSIGAIEGVGSMMRGGSWLETVSDRIAEAQTAANSDAANLRVAAGRLKIAASLVHDDEEAKKEAERKKQAKAKGVSISLKRPDGTTDELSRVGIGTAASGSEQKRYQEQSLRYLKELLSEARKGNSAADGIET